MNAPTRRAILAGTGAALAAGAAATLPAKAATPHPDAELLALCARIEALRRQINGMWLQGVGRRYYAPGGYIVDDDERERIVSPLEDKVSDLFGELTDQRVMTLEGVRAVARCLALHEPDLRYPMDVDVPGFGLTTDSGYVLRWLVDALTGGEITQATCMAEPGRPYRDGDTT